MYRKEIMESLEGKRKRKNVEKEIDDEDVRKERKYGSVEENEVKEKENQLYVCKERKEGRI